MNQRISKDTIKKECQPKEAESRDPITFKRRDKRHHFYFYIYDMRILALA